MTSSVKGLHYSIVPLNRLNWKWYQHDINFPSIKTCWRHVINCLLFSENTCSLLDQPVPLLTGAECIEQIYSGVWWCFITLDNSQWTTFWQPKKTSTRHTVTHAYLVKWSRWNVSVMLPRVSYLCIRYAGKTTILSNVFRILYTNLTRIFPITKTPNIKFLLHCSSKFSHYTVFKLNI